MKQIYTIRQERPEEYHAVENLVREAFWNKYMPGCDEHYIVHRFRSRADYLPQLSLVLEEEGELRAQILYSRAEICTDDGRKLPLVTFGPVSVLPQYQGRGYGGAIIRHTLALARQLGCGAVAITGDIGYYKRFGFVPGQSLGIYYDDIRDQPTDFFMVCELQPGWAAAQLRGTAAVYRDGPGYDVSGVDITAYDAQFPPRIKEKRPGQLWG